MMVQSTFPLASETSGVIVEGYYDMRAIMTDRPTDGIPMPTERLRGFYGTRVTHCATSRFMAVPIHEGPDVVRYSVSGTEFLREKLRTGQPPSFDDVKNAAKAVFPEAMEFRESGETCGCAAYFPALRPAGVTPFDQRDDAED